MSATENYVTKPNISLNIIAIIAISALAYLPLAGKFGYFNDDWYLMYSASAYGPKTFIDIFSVDRPGRALIMIPAYLLFGGNPLYYSFSAYLFRLLSGLALFWSLNMLWPGKRSTTTLMSLLFLIYPGFLSQPNAIDYQSHILGLAAALGSVAFTLKAIFTVSRFNKAAFHLLSILLGWLYLSQMEWYIGFEAFRWSCIFLLSSREDGTILQKTVRAFRWAYPTLVIPAAFLVWRLFFFASERRATDTEVQFELFRLYPLQTIFHWGVQVLRDLFDVLLAAWVIPLSQLMNYIQWWGTLLALLASAILFLIFSRKEDLHQTPLQMNVVREVLVLGFFTAVFGLVPIAMVNREVTFPAFSRYSLVSSVGVSIFIVALLLRFNGRILRTAVAGVLILIALLTHHGNSVKYAQENAAVQRFWWQVSWRVPQVEPRSTLIGYYPVGATEEDYFIWGPANLIYYPEKQASEEIQPTLFASVLNRSTVIKVLERERQKYDNRKNIVTYPNHRNLLIFTQPNASSCVHVINGLQPEFSAGDLDSIRVIGPYSEIERVIVNETSHVPPIVVFGTEPPHDWCYYYEKADLARQRGNWEEVLELGNEAFEQGLAPQDNIEWMPFLQAYALAANVERLTDLVPTITSDPYIAQQACKIVGSMSDLSIQVIETLNSLFCLE
jgi:hypothetical protein